MQHLLYSVLRKPDIINLPCFEKLGVAIFFDAHILPILHSGCDKETTATKGVVQHQVAWIREGADKIPAKFNRLLRRMVDGTLALGGFEINNIRGVSAPIAMDMRGVEISITPGKLVFADSLVIRLTG